MDGGEAETIEPVGESASAHQAATKPIGDVSGLQRLEVKSNLIQILDGLKGLVRRGNKEPK